MRLERTGRVLLEELAVYGDLKDYERRRVQIVLLWDDGWPWRCIAAMVKVSTATVCHAINDYRVAGLEGLFRAPAYNRRWPERLPQLVTLCAQEPPLTCAEIGAIMGMNWTNVATLCRRYKIAKPDLRGHRQRWDKLKATEHGRSG